MTERPEPRKVKSSLAKVAAGRRYYRENKERILEQQRQYRMGRIEYLRERSRRYSKTARGKAFKILNSLRMQKKFKEKERARRQLRWAVAHGKVIKPLNCDRCGADTKLEGHHPDYSKALEVNWLCIPCHKAEHGKWISSELQERPNDFL